MAYIVRACIAMAYIHMAYILMAYMRMACSKERCSQHARPHACTWTQAHALACQSAHKTAVGYNNARHAKAHPRR